MERRGGYGGRGREGGRGVGRGGRGRERGRGVGRGRRGCPQISLPKLVQEGSGRIIPIKRPDKDGAIGIRSARLRVNHFPVKFNSETVIMHYDIDVKPAMPNGRRVAVSKSILSLVRNRLSSDNPLQFPLSMTAYDGEKNIFSAVSLPTGSFRVELSDGEDMRGQAYIINIMLVNELKLCKLRDYLNGHLMSVPRDILQGMDLVMKENPGRCMVSVGRNFFPRESRRGDDLGRGIVASRGFQPRLKATSQGLAMCLDYSVWAFRKQMPVIDFLGQHIHGFNINNFQNFRRKVNDALKGLKVTVTHRRCKQNYIIRGLTKENTRQISFIAEDPEGRNPPRQLRIIDYFREKYDKDIMLKDIPCLDLGKGNKKNHVPMEFCVLVERQRYPKECLDKKAAKLLKNISLAEPEVRKREICNLVSSEDGPCGYETKIAGHLLFV